MLIEQRRVNTDREPTEFGSLDVGIPFVHGEDKYPCIKQLNSMFMEFRNDGTYVKALSVNTPVRVIRINMDWEIL